MICRAFPRICCFNCVWIERAEQANTSLERQLKIIDASSDGAACSFEVLRVGGAGALRQDFLKRSQPNSFWSRRWRQRCVRCHRRCKPQSQKKEDSMMQVNFSS